MSPAAGAGETRVVTATPPDFSAFRKRALLAGAAGFAILLAGLFLSPDQFYRSYLLGFTLWVGIALGCMGILMLQHLSGGAWGVVLRRILEAGTRTIPFLFGVFGPLLVGIKRLYHRGQATTVDAISTARALCLGRDNRKGTINALRQILCLEILSECNKD